MGRSRSYMPCVILTSDQLDAPQVGSTALRTAAANGQVAVCDVLLRGGAGAAAANEVRARVRVRVTLNPKP